ALREDEPVVRRRLRRGEVVPQVPGQEHGHQGGGGHPGGGVPRLRGGRAAHGVDPKLLTELAPELDVVHVGNVAGMRVAVAFDHRGVKLRERVLEELTALGHEAVALGADTDAVRIDYPDKAREVGEAIRSGEAERGVLVCGSGVGASVAANKLPGSRAALWHASSSAT